MTCFGLRADVPAADRLSLGRSRCTMAIPIPMKDLLLQTAGAIPWAVFFIVAPFVECVIVGSAVWLPLLVWRERSRSARYGFWPGALSRLVVVIAIVAAAVAAPAEYERTRKRIGALPRTSATMADLVAADVIFPLRDARHERLALSLPSSTPTLPEIVRAINEQTRLRARVLGCGNGASLLAGARAVRIVVYEPPN